MVNNVTGMMGYGNAYEDTISDPYLHFEQDSFGQRFCAHLCKIDFNRVATRCFEDSFEQDGKIEAPMLCEMISESPSYPWDAGTHTTDTANNMSKEPINTMRSRVVCRAPGRERLLRCMYMPKENTARNMPLRGWKRAHENGTGLMLSERNGTDHRTQTRGQYRRFQPRQVGSL